MPREQNEPGKMFQCLIVFAFFAHFCIGAFFSDQVELTKHPLPPIFLFFM